MHLPRSRSLRWLLTVAAAGLAFEAALLVHWHYAEANDLDLLLMTSGATQVPPPNIMFLFDTSGSMNNLPCEDFGGTSDCASTNLVAKTVTNGATICEMPGMRDAWGKDLNNDGALEHYAAAFNSTGTFVGYSYAAVFTDNAGTSTFTSKNTFTHTVNNPWTQVATGTDASAAITATCAGLANCNQRKRCEYSLKVLGYFWESGSCGSGDPTGTCGNFCGDGICSTGETPCNCPYDCKTSKCGDGCCSGSETAASCAGDCKGTLGSACSPSNKCNTGMKCSSGGICGYCASSSDCTSGNSCVSTGCDYNFCTPSQTCLYPSTTTSGIQSNVGPYALGDFLNFYPPKMWGLKGAFWNTITNLKADVRIGARDFSMLSNSTLTGQPVSPTCSSSMTSACFDGTTDTKCFDPTGKIDVTTSSGTTKRSMLEYLSSLTASGGTPLAQALDNTGKQFSLTTTGGYDPICNFSANTSCTANNFVVIVTDGLPSGDVTSWGNLPYVSKLKSYTANLPDNGYLLDEVATVLASTNARPDLKGTTDITTYTVSFGLLDSHNPPTCAGLLATTATFGGGHCVPATSASELESAFNGIVTEISTRTHGFTAPSVPAVRTGGGSQFTSAVFRPSTNFPLWEGHLYAFAICDEALGVTTGTPCSCKPDTGPNQMCVQDANGDAITYDDKGYLTSKPFWDAALCLAGNAANVTYPTKVASDPFQLNVSACYVSAANRVIKTAIATIAGPTTSLTNADVIDFSAGNVSTGSALLTALNVGGVVGTGQDLVNWLRGYDAFDVDGDGNKTEDRNINNIQQSGNVIDGWWKLGEIFHSTPGIVQRPDPNTVGYSMGAWADFASYQKFMQVYTARDRVILVGANDGMLHAFHAGAWSSSTGKYDQGTGKELWAFVSPEALPKLQYIRNNVGALSHQFLVDGSVEVRDVWTGGTADKSVASNYIYWRTVAIFGHRDGGSTYVALDVTDIDNPPVVLWQFPQASMSTEVAEMARSWLEVPSGVAAIGPLRELSGSNLIDHWVAFLSGGYDPLDKTGRMLVAVDIPTGNVVWEASHATTSSMNYSFPATPVFYSTNAGKQPYIEGVIVGDHGGQVWQVPTPAQTLSGGKFTFTPQRVFIAGPSSGSTPIPPTTGTAVTGSTYQRWPFYFAARLAGHDNLVRVLLGTGDRDMLVPHDNTTPIGGTSGYVCTDAQRLYAFDVSRTPSAGSTPCGSSPCRESDLVQVDLSGTWATSSSKGWWYALDAGEKSVQIAGIATVTGSADALYSTFLPTTACGGANESCVSDNKGIGRLYARNYISGKPLDWNNNGSISDDKYVSLGDGVPSAPSVSTGVSSAGATTSIITGDGGGGVAAQSGSALTTQLEVDLIRVSVPASLHSVLHPPP